MKRLITAILLCMAASTSMSLAAVAQEDASVPQGAVANDTRVFLKGGLDDVETVEFIIMTNWEMDTAESAENFYKQLSESVPTDLVERESAEQLEDRNDNQILIVGDDQFGGPVTIILFQKDNYVGTWMALGDLGQDVILAGVYNEFFGTGFDPADPFPVTSPLLEGYTSTGEDIGEED